MFSTSDDAARREVRIVVTGVDRSEELEVLGAGRSALFERLVPALRGVT